MNARGTALVLALFVACGGSSSTPSSGGTSLFGELKTSPAESPAKDRSGGGGYAAPDFTVTTFEGEEFRLAVHKGTPVVLNFWESW
ncbi:MAG TPA: hypothetical protein VNP73_05770 [Actinomycetota bacterium]|nr:hypothetical protein [Actinomycetota bacterium]